MRTSLTRAEAVQGIYVDFEQLDDQPSATIQAFWVKSDRKRNELLYVLDQHLAIDLDSDPLQHWPSSLLDRTHRMVDFRGRA